MTVIQDMLETCEKNGLPLRDAYINHSVFLELCEGQKLWHVNWLCCEELKILYCTGRRDKEGPRFTYIPISNSKGFSMEDVERWQKVLETDRITLAILEADSSIVFYDISKGLVKPDTAVSVRREGKLHFPVSTYMKKKLLTEASQNESPQDSSSEDSQSSSLSLSSGGSLSDVTDDGGYRRDVRGVLTEI